MMGYLGVELLRLYAAGHGSAKSTMPTQPRLGWAGSGPNTKRASRELVTYHEKVDEEMYLGSLMEELKGNLNATKHKIHLICRKAIQTQWRTLSAGAVIRANPEITDSGEPAGTLMPLSGFLNLPPPPRLDRNR